MYNEFSLIYDRLMDEVGLRADDWANYLKELLKLDENNYVCLELGAGTGRISEHLADSFKSLTLLDSSNEMLSIAEQRLRDKENTFIISGDLANFNLNKRYDLIMSLGDSVNYLPSLELIESFLQSSFNHLVEGGILTFDFKTIKCGELYKENIDIFDLEDLYCVYETDYVQNTIYHDLTWFTKVKDNSYRKYEESQEQYLYSIKNIKKLIKRVGFREIKLYNFNTAHDGDENNYRIQVFCKK